MIYQFKASDGEIIERNFSMREAPELGTPITFKGKVYRRILSPIGRVGLREYDENLYPRVSNALPRNLAGCQHDAKGRPIILNKQHEREILKQTGFTREYDTSEQKPREVVHKAPEPVWTRDQIESQRARFNQLMK